MCFEIVHDMYNCYDRFQQWGHPDMVVNQLSIYYCVQRTERRNVTMPYFVKTVWFFPAQTQLSGAYVNTIVASVETQTLHCPLPVYISTFIVCVHSSSWRCDGLIVCNTITIEMAALQLLSCLYLIIQVYCK